MKIAEKNEMKAGTALDSETVAFETRSVTSKATRGAAFQSAGDNNSRFYLAGLFVLVLYAVVRSVFAAASKPFWHDEICTWILAQLPGPSAIWGALKHAADSNPPVFYLIERASSRLLANEQIAFRIPSIVGFCCVLVCMFVFIKRRSGSSVALTCAAVTLITTLFGFAEEARPYSLMAACLALALVCYQRAPKIQWMMLMAAALGFAETMHYYAIFGLIPFLLAEAAFFLWTRRFRWGVWLALAVGVVPLAIFWPLLMELRSYYGSHFWSPPSLSGVANTYGMLLRTSSDLGIAGAGVAAFAIIGSLVLGEREVKPRDSGEGEAVLPERVLTLGFIVLPFFVYVAAKIGHGGMAERYSLLAVLGFPLASAYVMQWLGQRGALLFTSFVLLVLGFQEFSFWPSHLHRLSKLGSPSRPVEMLASTVGDTDLPVVISANVNYLAIAHYASPQWKNRFFTIVDGPKALTRTGSDSVEAQLEVLRSYTSMQAPEFSSFVSVHPVFLLYSHRAAQIGDWWPVELAGEGASVQLVAGDSAARLYRVDVRKSN